MTYEPSEGAGDIVNTDCIANIYQLATLNEEQARVFKEIAANEPPPPQAPDRKSVRENCQS